jgi:hypothetical protein
MGKQKASCVHFHFDTEDTLFEKDVADGVVDELVNGVSRVDHETIGEFHGFGTGSTELARNDHLATLSTRLHDKSKNTITCPDEYVFV